MIFRFFAISQFRSYTIRDSNYIIVLKQSQIVTKPRFLLQKATTVGCFFDVFHAIMVRQGERKYRINRIYSCFFDTVVL